MRERSGASLYPRTLDDAFGVGPHGSLSRAALSRCLDDQDADDAPCMDVIVLEVFNVLETRLSCAGWLLVILLRHMPAQLTQCRGIEGLQVPATSEDGEAPCSG